MEQALPLRDLHPSVAPPWWPPAPGWWAVAAVLGLALAALLAWRWSRARRRRRAAALFDAEVAAAATPAEAVAAMSALLRRAARVHHPGADRLAGTEWRALLDAGRDPPRFAGAAGELLGDGAFRRDVAAADVEALRVAARARFLEWMAGRP